MIPEEFRKNAVFGDWPLHYDKLLPETEVPEPGTQLHKVQTEKIERDTGVTVLPNGDVKFRIYAPAVKEVKIRSKAFAMSLVKTQDGYFEGVLKFEPGLAGPHSFDFIFDGTTLLYPYVPISWHRNRPVNYVDIIDPETPYVLVNDVPHGSVTREIYWSAVMGRWERCLVYTPPGYMKGEGEYPVLYLQHGATENEVTWEYNGRVSSIMDNMIASGEVKPFIIVMNNGMIAYPDKPGYGTAFGDILLTDCIPFIERTYRVKTDKWNRAMAGLSMGSSQTSHYGLTHPELFGYLGLFSGFMRNREETGDSPHLAIMNDPAVFAESFKVFFRSVGDQDALAPRFYEDDEICHAKGVDVCPNFYRVVYEGQTHEFGAWRRALHDFAPLLFR